jgi:hypothetical protein
MISLILRELMAAHVYRPFVRGRSRLASLRSPPGTAFPTRLSDAGALPQQSSPPARGRRPQQRVNALDLGDLVDGNVVEDAGLHERAVPPQYVDERLRASLGQPPAAIRIN